MRGAVRVHAAAGRGHRRRQGQPHHEHAGMTYCIVWRSKLDVQINLRSNYSHANYIACIVGGRRHCEVSRPGGADLLRALHRHHQRHHTGLQAPGYVYVQVYICNNYSQIIHGQTMLVTGRGQILYVDLGAGHYRLGGTALSTVCKQAGRPHIGSSAHGGVQGHDHPDAGRAAV